MIGGRGHASFWPHFDLTWNSISLHFHAVMHHHMDLGTWFGTYVNMKYKYQISQSSTQPEQNRWRSWCSSSNGNYHWYKRLNKMEACGSAVRWITFSVVDEGLIRGAAKELHLHGRAKSAAAGWLVCKEAKEAAGSVRPSSRQIRRLRALAIWFLARYVRRAHTLHTSFVRDDDAGLKRRAAAQLKVFVLTQVVVEVEVHYR